MPTAATWGDFDLGITQAYIRQNLWGNKFQYTVGKIFAPNFIDAYPFFDDNRQFLNQSFSTSPTIASPLRGAGAVATVYPTDGGLYVLGGVYRANSSDTGWTIDEVFDTGELFYQLEVGWSALARTGVPVQARGPMDSNNIHLTGWYKDAQPDQSNATLQPQARGLAFNANFTVGDNLMWFFRAGLSDGWVNDRAVSAGFGWRPTEQFSDLLRLRRRLGAPERARCAGAASSASSGTSRPSTASTSPRTSRSPRTSSTSGTRRSIPDVDSALGRRPPGAHHLLSRQCGGGGLSTRRRLALRNRARWRPPPHRWPRSGTCAERRPAATRRRPWKCVPARIWSWAPPAPAATAGRPGALGGTRRAQRSARPRRDRTEGQAPRMRVRGGG